MCCVIHSTFTKADVASLPKWCLLTNNTADYFQFDLDYPEVLETNCDTIYPLVFTTREYIILSPMCLVCRPGFIPIDSDGDIMLLLSPRIDLRVSASPLDDVLPETYRWTSMFC